MHEGTEIRHPADTSILAQHQDYVFKILQPCHAKETVELLSTVFFNGEPLAVAFYKAFPVDTNQGLEDFRKMWDCFIGEFTTNNISVGCFDRQNNDELVGVSVAKDFLYTPEGFDENYMSRLTTVSCVIKFEQQIISMMDEGTQNILGRKGTVMDIMAVAIKPKHSGKKLLGKMMEQNLLLGEKAGYAHALCFAANFRTSITLKRLDFVMIQEGHASSFEAYGARPFEKIEKQQEYSKIWMKGLCSHAKV